MENKEYLTVAEAAAMLGTKETTIRVYITTGRLKSQLVNGRRMIAQTEIERYIQDKQKFLGRGGFSKKKLI